MFEPEIFILLLMVAFLAGFIDAIAGGGGLLTVPALLTAGVAPHETLGTNKLCATFGSFNAARTYIKRGIFQPLLWKAASLATFIGAAIGTVLAHLTSDDVLGKILPVVIVLAAVYMLFPQRKRSQLLSREVKPGTSSSVITGSVLGAYDGYAGPGTGAFWTTLVMAIYKLDIVTASGVARFMNFISNFVSLVTFMLLGHVNYVLGLSMGATLIIGSYLGANAAIRYGAKFIRPVFIIFVIAAAGRVAYVEWFVT